MYSFGSCKKQVNFNDPNPGPGAYEAELAKSNY